jgi:hypothetical protein
LFKETRTLGRKLVERLIVKKKTLVSAVMDQTVKWMRGVYKMTEEGWFARLIIAV